MTKFVTWWSFLNQTNQQKQSKKQQQIKNQTERDCPLKEGENKRENGRKTKIRGSVYMLYGVTVWWTLYIILEERQYIYMLYGRGQAKSILASKHIWSESLSVRGTRVLAILHVAETRFLLRKKWVGLENSIFL